MNLIFKNKQRAPHSIAFCALLLAGTMGTHCAYSQTDNNHSSAISSVLETFDIRASVQANVIQMDLNQVAKRMLENSLDVQISQAREDYARAKKNESWGKLLPSLEAGYRQSRFKGGVQVFNGNPERASITNLQPELRATWEFSLGGKQLFNTKALQYHLKEATYDKQIETLKALESATKNYYEYIQAFQDKNLAEKGVEEAKLILDMQQERLKQGVGVQLEVLDAQVQLGNRNNDLLQAQHSILKSHYDLVMNLAYPIDTELNPSEEELTPLAWYDSVPSLNGLVQQSLSQNPEYLQQKAAYDASQAEYRSQWSGILPDIKVSTYINGIGRKTNDLEFSHFAGVELTADLLTNMGTKQYQGLKESKAKLTEAKLQLEKKKLETQNAISQAYLDIKMAKSQLTVNQEAMKAAEEAYEQASGRLKYGLGSQLEVTGAMRSLAEARTRWTDSVLNYNLSQVHLAKELGTLDQFLLQPEKPSKVALSP